MPNDYFNVEEYDRLSAEQDRLDKERQANSEKEEAKAAAEQEADAKYQAELEAGHSVKDAKDFGVKENLTELRNAFTGGTRDTLSSYATLPERAVDIASGSMVREIQEKGQYTPGFNPLGGDLNPITKTWWGNFIRTGVHFGTMAIPIVGWGGAVAKGTGAFAKAAQWTVASSNWIAKGATVGAVSDLFSEYSQEANGLQVIRDRFGFIDTPCTTKDADHPALKTVKSVCEGVGLGIPLEGTGRAIAKVRVKQGLTNNPTNDVLKKVDKIQSGKLLKAEKASKALVNKNLRQSTRCLLYTSDAADE